MLVGAAALAATPDTPAQLYRWVDEKGKVHYSDTVPPQANDAARAKLRPDGIVLERAERAPSAEERRAAAERAEAMAKERAEQDARARLDRAMVDRYRSLADFDVFAERSRQMADLELTSLVAREPTVTSRIRALLAGAGPRPDSKEMVELRALQIEAETLAQTLTARIEARQRLETSLREDRARLATLLAQRASETAATPARPASGK